MADDEDEDSVLVRSTLYRDLCHGDLQHRFADDEDHIERMMEGINRRYANERRLNHVSVEAFIARGFSDACSMAHDHLIWLDDWSFITAGSMLTSDYEGLGFSRKITFTAGSDEITLSLHPTQGNLALACNFMCRLLATSAKSTVSIASVSGRTTLPAESLSQLFEAHQNLKILHLAFLILDVALCRALEAASRNGVEFELVHCEVPDNAAAQILTESIRQNRGLTKIEDCMIDASLLVDALRGNTSVKVLKLGTRRTTVGDFAAFVRSLSENRGLTTLQMRHDFTNETWALLLCRSLQPHPTLEELELQSYAYAADDRLACAEDLNPHHS
jgi:hypothetical protein